MKLDSIEDIVADIREGKMVVMMDDEGRENEGDLIMAACKVRPEDINFMASHARGLICMPITRERCKQLKLPLMVNDNHARYSTAFTISIEAAEGVTTGISAYDRAHTIRTAAQPDVLDSDITQPGHVFPLMAQPGGVLTRAGHTEASVDLSRLAGLEPAATLVEIMNEDGSMARRPELETFAKKHKLRIGTVADLIRYRLENEHTVKRLHQQTVSTDLGEFELYAYEDQIDRVVHFAMVKGPISPDVPALVRVHLPDLLGDGLALRRSDLGMPLKVALEHLAQSDCGVLVALGNQEDGHSALARLKQEAPPPVDPDAAPPELRTYGIGAQILRDVGVRCMRVLSAPKRFHGLAGFGLEVVEYVDSHETAES